MILNHTERERVYQTALHQGRTDQEAFLLARLRALHEEPAPLTHAGRAAHQAAFRELLAELEQVRAHARASRAS